jgi:hypothetical protein
MGDNIHLVFQDGNLSHSYGNGTTWTSANNTIASVTDDIYSVTTDDTNIWALSVSGTTATNLYKCTSCAAASSWSTLTAPFTSETNVLSASLSYDSTNTDLYAAIIKDSLEQAYFKSTDSTTISWSGETSLGFTIGDLDNISTPLASAGSAGLGAVLRQGSNLEFRLLGAPTNDLLMRHGQWFNSGDSMPFTF